LISLQLASIGFTDATTPTLFLTSGVTTRPARTFGAWTEETPASESTLHVKEAKFRIVCLDTPSGRISPDAITGVTAAWAGDIRILEYVGFCFSDSAHFIWEKLEYVGRMLPMQEEGENVRMAGGFKGE